MIEAYIGNMHSRIIVGHVLVGPVTADESMQGICDIKQAKHRPRKTRHWGMAAEGLLRNNRCGRILSTGTNYQHSNFIKYQV